MLQTLVAYLPTLLLTLLLEAAVVAAIARRGERALVVRVCLALNLLTHPLATLLRWQWQPEVLATEALVVFCEWLGYAQILRCTLPRALWFATAANAVSWFAGVVWWAVTVH